jgi:REP element-mobilizing transposase RayT
MAKREPFEPGAYYHVYNRGVDRRSTAEDGEDWERQLATLIAANGQAPIDFWKKPRQTFADLAAKRGEPLVDVCAYALMPNHFHLILRIIEGRGASTFLQKYLTSYTEYFNFRHGRSGVLYQGRTKAKRLKNSSQLLTAVAYVNENPLDLLCSSPASLTFEQVDTLLAGYRFSSYQDYARGTVRPESAILQTEALPSGFGRALNGTRTEYPMWFDRTVEPHRA